MDAKFLTSAHEPSQFPPDRGWEVAVAGRSNSGKSSAINAIVGRKNLARTGKTPGRTQLINFFELEEDRRLVDLPGYGYARVAAQIKDHWQGLAQAYFHSRRSLKGLMVTVDCRRGVQDLDELMLSWAGDARVAAAVLLTKADKLSRSAARVLARRVGERIEVPVVLFSAPKHQGVETARAWLEERLEMSRQKTPRVRDSGDTPGAEGPGMG